MGSLPLIFAQAGSGSSGFGGGGGGGGGGFGGGSSGSGEGDPLVAVVVFGLFGVFLSLPGDPHAPLPAQAARARPARCARRRRRRPRTTPTSPRTSSSATRSRSSVPHRWHGTPGDRAAPGPARGTGPARGVERAGWTTSTGRAGTTAWRCVADPTVLYVGITNREDDDEDRAVVRIEAKLKRVRGGPRGPAGHAQGREGRARDARRVLDPGAPRRRSGWSSRSSSARRATISWTSRSWPRRGRTTQRLEDEVADGARRGRRAFPRASPPRTWPRWSSTATRARTPSTCPWPTRRFAPGRARGGRPARGRGLGEAVDGDDAALERWRRPRRSASCSTAATRRAKTRLVVRGPRVKRIRIAAVQVEQVPATMTVERGAGRTAATWRTATRPTVVSGSKDSAATFTERWTLALDGPADAPWRIVVYG